MLLFVRCSWALKLPYVEKRNSDIIPQTTHLPSASFSNHIQTGQLYQPWFNLSKHGLWVGWVWTSLSQSSFPVFVVWLQHPRIFSTWTMLPRPWFNMGSWDGQWVNAKSILIAQPAEFQHAVRWIRQVFAQLFFHLLRHQKPSATEAAMTKTTDRSLVSCHKKMVNHLAYSRNYIYHHIKSQQQQQQQQQQHHHHHHHHHHHRIIIITPPHPLYNHVTSQNKNINQVPQATSQKQRHQLTQQNLNKIKTENYNLSFEVSKLKYVENTWCSM